MVFINNVCARYAFILFLMNAKTAQAQYYFFNNKYYDNPVIVEIGAGVGLINCLTDLGGSKGEGKRFVKDINWCNTLSSKEIHGGIVFNDSWGLRLEAAFGKLQAYDSLLKKYKDDPATMGRYSRNLSFRSRITELSLSVEWYPYSFFNTGDHGPPAVCPYLFAGIGRFWFNPQTFYKGRWVDLQPLRLEGQGFAEYPDRDLYQLHATCYPVGMGARWEAGPLLSVRFEINYRFTTTDYLDDVSVAAYVNPALFAKYLDSRQASIAEDLYNRSRAFNNSGALSSEIRGQSKNNDAYFTCAVKASLILGRKRILT